MIIVAISVPDSYRDSVCSVVKNPDSIQYFHSIIKIRNSYHKYRFAADICNKMSIFAAEKL